jgi:hypothetical protein
MPAKAGIQKLLIILDSPVLSTGQAVPTKIALDLELE